MITQDNISKLGTILGIWAHPDDETFCAGGIIAAATDNGQTVICVTATRGEHGVQDETRWPAEHLGAVREEELHDAMAVLGVKEHEFLDYPDGHCQNIDENEAVNKLVELINKYQPDSLLCFGTDGLTGNPDHKTVANWAIKAKSLAARPVALYQAVLVESSYEGFKPIDKALNFFYNIDKPPIISEDQLAINLQLNNKLYERKQSALAAMPSQYEKMFKLFNSELRPAFGTEAFTEFKS